jgi:hypothetical protein
VYSRSNYRFIIWRFYRNTVAGSFKISNVITDLILTFLKGVVILHKNLIAVIASGFKVVEVRPDDVYVGFLPLAHVLELVIENAILLAGASIGYGNARTLTATNMKNSYGDIKELRPTLMAGVRILPDYTGDSIDRQ